MTRFMRSTAALLIVAALLLSFAPTGANAQSRTTIARAYGTAFEKGTYVTMTAGAAIAAKDAVYLSGTASTVYKLPISGNTNTLLGVAPIACSSGSTSCLIQITGKASVVSDAAISVGDRVGSPTATAGRIKTVTAALDSSLVLGRALTSSSGAAETITILIEHIAPTATLTNNRLVIGGGAGVTVDDAPGLATDGTSQIQLGVAGASVGSVKLNNATSGDITISPASGALGSRAWTVPAASDTFVGKATTDELTNKTLTSAVAKTALLSNAVTDTIGTAAAPFGSVYVGGAATNNIQITGTATGARVATLPDATITVSGATVKDCGTANACSATDHSAAAKIVYGQTAALDGASPAVATVTGMPAFSGQTTYVCTATAVGATAITTIVTAENQSATSVKFTATNSANQVLNYICVGY